MKEGLVYLQAWAARAVLVPQAGMVSPAGVPPKAVAKEAVGPRTCKAVPRPGEVSSEAQGDASAARS